MYFGYPHADRAPPTADYRREQQDGISEIGIPWRTDQMAQGGPAGAHDRPHTDPPRSTCRPSVAPIRPWPPDIVLPVDELIDDGGELEQRG